jgi:uncharacterized protein (DUF2147 family)
MISFLLATMAAAAHPAPSDPIVGTWMNRKGTVAVRTAHCGPSICARVVWADPAAQEAARAGGTEHLVGTDLFRGVRPAGEGMWQGEVFVPDMGETADATITMTGPGELQIDGCRFGGLLCKQQFWHRVNALPRGR